MIWIAIIRDAPTCSRFFQWGASVSFNVAYISTGQSMFYRECKISIILWSVFCSWQWNIHYSCFWPFCPEGGERGGLGGWVGTKEPADCNIGVQIIAGTLSRISTLCTLTKVFHFILSNFTESGSWFKMRPLVLWRHSGVSKAAKFLLSLN